MTVYRPALVRQADGSAYQWYNCAPASAAMALDRHTLGKRKSTGARIRACSGVRQYRGLNPNEIINAVRRCYTQTLSVRYAISWATLINTLRSGRGAQVLGHYGSLGVYSSQRSFTGNHSMYVNEVLPNGNLLVYDPLAKAAREMPQSVIRNFCGDLNVGGRALGRGWVYAIVTKVTNPVANPVPKPPAGAFVMRFGGVMLGRPFPVYHTKLEARQRRSPYVRPDNIGRVVPVGTTFTPAQKTRSGTIVAGSSVWYGNSNGTVWMHGSVLR